MTPKEKEHIANVQRLLVEMEAAKQDVERWRSDLGLAAKTFIRGQKLQRPALALTPKRMEALKQAEQRLKELEDEYYAAIGIPRFR